MRMRVCMRVFCMVMQEFQTYYTAASFALVFHY